jgi:uncharacterized iron-regulated protein
MILLGVVLTVSACTMKPALFKIEGLDTPLAAGTIVDGRNGQPVSFDQLIGQLAQARVIYVGERHTDRIHHQIQLQIIRALVEKGMNIRVGMEMFDHTYQAVLDQWSAGGMEWEAFLKKSHWYANWKFDDSLYKDIMVYIQERHLKLVGLNIPFCIPPKIAVGGLESLSDYDRAQLPDQIDTTQPEHRAYVEEIFKMHQMKGREDFENFYAAQCAWEDGMAQAIADNLDQATMVVLAGNGHIIRKFGIPNRAYKRSQAPFRTVYLATPPMTASLTDGDYIWVTSGEGGSPHMMGPR